MIVSGALTVGVGVLLILSNGTASLGGFVPISTQYQAESWAATTGAGIDNVLFLVVVLAVAAVGASVVWIATKRSAERS
ncbi:MAG: hypothetical protein ACOH14_00840 [Rhodoglobus sp.]